MSEQMYKVHWSDIRGHEGVQDTKLSLEEALKLKDQLNDEYEESGVHYHIEPIKSDEKETK